MSYMDKLKTDCTEVLTIFNNSPAIKRMAEGNITIDHYKSLMKQIAHHARENPQLQALATVYFRGHQRKIIQTFFKHATSEIGHDQLALNDVSDLGEDVSEILFENPLPDTIALISYGFYQIYNLEPIGYLGYLFFLEFMPTQSGSNYIKMLDKIGVPESAMTFIKDHTAIDLGHTRLMERYVEQLVTNDNEYNSILYAMKTTGHLYSKMVEGAFDQIDKPKYYGWSTTEMRYKDSTSNEKILSTAGI